MNPMRILAITLLVAAVSYLGVCTLLFFAQDSMIFLRQPLRAESPALASRLGAEELRLSTQDGVLLHGWSRKAKTPGTTPWLIYFGGNAEEVTGMLEELSRYAGVGVALANYRGYGLSGGEPSERAFLADGVALYDALAARPEVDRERILVMGRSLGTGTAAYVASQRKVRAVVLLSPYDSLTAVAARVYPWLPVAFLMRHPFDTLSRAPAISSPMLAVAGSLDTIVPPSHSQRLREAWKGEAQLHLLVGAGHNDLLLHPGFWPRVDEFIERNAR
ncbi:MAG: alpha/beta hydrolase [Betaproteobacteria bacterium]|nr:alpha/beta hydrolase [Betaproteobacteria bacterium]